MLNTNDARSHVFSGRYDIVFVAKWGKENESAVNQLALGSPKYPVECPPILWHSSQSLLRSKRFKLVPTYVISANCKFVVY